MWDFPATVKGRVWSADWAVSISTRGHNKYSSFWSDCVFAVVTVKIITTVPTPTQEILRTRDRGGGRGYLLRVVLPWHGEAGAASSSFTPPAPPSHPPSACWQLLPVFRWLLCCCSTLRNSPPPTLIPTAALLRVGSARYKILNQKTLKPSHQILTIKIHNGAGEKHSLVTNGNATSCKLFSLSDRITYHNRHLRNTSLSFCH